MSIVHGRSPDGETATGTNPVLMGYEDESGNAKRVTAGSGMPVQVSGRNIADGTNGNSESYILDSNNYPIKRVVIDANWPYNDMAKTLNVSNRMGTTGAYEGLTVLSTAAKVLTPQVYNNGGLAVYDRARITVETGEIRYTLHNSPATAIWGHAVKPGQTILLDNYADIVAFSAYATTRNAELATLTLASVVATNVVTINGMIFTCVASGATGPQFDVGVSDTATATNLVAAINAYYATLGVWATASGAVVTLTRLGSNLVTVSNPSATITPAVSATLRVSYFN